MATGGWAGVRPDLLTQRNARRPTIDEQVAAMGEQALERDLLAWVVALLVRLREQGVIRRWHHVPDVRRRRGEQPGMLDLHVAVTPGIMPLPAVLALELKRPDGKGRVSPEQLDWLDSWGDRGAVCCSQTQVLEHLRRWVLVR
jgi:hypothetical protein